MRFPSGRKVGLGNTHGPRQDSAARRAFEAMIRQTAEASDLAAARRWYETWQWMLWDIHGYPKFMFLDSRCF